MPTKFLVVMVIKKDNSKLEEVEITELEQKDCNYQELSERINAVMLSLFSFDNIREVKLKQLIPIG